MEIIEKKMGNICEKLVGAVINLSYPILDIHTLQIMPKYTLMKKTLLTSVKITINIKC